MYWCFVICGFSTICTAIFVSWEAALPFCCCWLALLFHAQPTAPRSLRSLPFVHCSRAVNFHCGTAFVWFSLIFQETLLFPFPSVRVLNSRFVTRGKPCVPTVGVCLLRASLRFSRFLRLCFKSPSFWLL